MLVRYSVKEYEDVFGGSIEDIKIYERKVLCVYMNDEYDDCGYVGCGYDDGSYSIVGLGRDCMCSYEFMCDMLHS